MATRYPLRIAAALALAVSVAACDDDDDPTGPVLDFDDIATQCLEGTIDDATTTETVTGTINADDCRLTSDPFDGRLEAYALPQSAFGENTSARIELDSDFDGAIWIIDAEGNLLEEIDELDEPGVEEYVLEFDLDPSEPTYYIVVFSFDGDDSGAYTMDVGPEAI